MKSGLVSIIIPTYNRSDTISRSIRSAIMQTYPEIEVIIVDDASTDDTKDVVQSFTDSRIQYLRHFENMGGGTARNTGIKVSRGEYLAFLDSDDEWLPDKLERQVQLFESLPNSYGLVYCGFFVRSKDGKIIKGRPPEKRGDIFFDMLSRNVIGTLSVAMIKKEFIDKIDGFDEDLNCRQDYDLYLRLTRICKCDFIINPLVVYSEQYSISRISNSKRALVVGHQKIFRKHGAEIRKLPPEMKAIYFARVGSILIEAGAIRQGVGNIICALSSSRTLASIMKVVASFLGAVKKRIRFSLEKV